MSMTTLVLPAAVVTKHQFVKFLAAFEVLDDALTTQEIRAASGATAEAAAAPSALITQFIEENKLEITNSEARRHTLDALKELRKTAPIVHMTFAAEADLESLVTMVHWFRQNMSKYTLIEVGLQPGLVAGAYVRSQNHVYDYSLRARLIGQRQTLVSALKAAQ